MRAEWVWKTSEFVIVYGEWVILMKEQNLDFVNYSYSILKKMILQERIRLLRLATMHFIVSDALYVESVSSFWGWETNFCSPTLNFNPSGKFACALSQLPWVQAGAFVDRNHPAKFIDETQDLLFFWSNLSLKYSIHFKSL